MKECTGVETNLITPAAKKNDEHVTLHLPVPLTIQTHLWPERNNTKYLTNKVIWGHDARDHEASIYYR